MKKGIMVVGAIAIFGTVSGLRAQDNNSNNSTVNSNNGNTTVVHEDKDNDHSPYHDQEITLDVFGGGTLDKNGFDHLSGEEVKHEGRLGVGGGGSIFFVRNLGIEGEVYTENTDEHFIDETSGSLVLRAPIGDSGLAPYIFGGGGHLFDPVSSSFGHGGAGLEFRFCHNFGIFVDGRWVFTDKIGNYGMGRAGLRLAF